MKETQFFVTLANLANGSAQAVFSEELEKVLENIADGRYPAKAKRTLTITVELEPDDDRRRATMAIHYKKKLPARAIASQVFVRKHGSKFVGLENDPEQLGLFEDEERRSLLIPDETQ